MRAAPRYPATAAHSHRVTHPLVRGPPLSGQPTQAKPTEHLAERFRPPEARSLESAFAAQFRTAVLELGAARAEVLFALRWWLRFGKSSQDVGPPESPHKVTEPSRPAQE